MDSDIYEARPGQGLRSHLEGVSDNAVKLLTNETVTSSANQLKSIVEVVAKLHDAGKYTSYFQTYLHESGRRSPNLRERHADVGAYLSFLALAANDHPLEECAAGFFAVMRHHGGLPNLNAYQSNLRTREKQFNALSDKLRDIDQQASGAVDELLSEVTEGDLLWSDVPIENPRRQCRPLFNIQETEGFYPLLLRIWSTLNCSDKLDAASVPLSERVSRPDPNKIGFADSASGITKELNELRTAARKGAVENMLGQEEPGLYTLTLPTGFGKTFAGIEAALSKASRKEGRVIYALPYTTVIDQVDEEIRDQFGVSPSSDQYTIHHHLADTRTELNVNDERVSSRAEVMYGETWQAGFVLTTFVQLFESLAGPANVQSMKLPALKNSVIIVDEPQALPRQWWHLISRLASVLVNDYNSSLILMTATQPRFVDEYNLELDSMELIKNTDRYFSFLARNPRVQFKVSESLKRHLTDSGSEATLPLKDAAEHLVSSTNAEGVNRLAINNTVRSAAGLNRAIGQVAEERGYEVVSLNEGIPSFVKNHSTSILEALRSNDPSTTLSDLANTYLMGLGQNGDNKGILLGSLTAALRPIERALIIEVLRRIVDVDKQTPFDQWPTAISTTQLVEAGVDISFDQVYRDFAPMPSIVQAAGRCNRSFNQETGLVTLWRLGGKEGERPPSEITYHAHQSRLEATRTTLRANVSSDDNLVEESQMISDVIESYYDNLYAMDHTVSESDDLVRSFDNVEGEKLRDATLIDDDSEEFLVIANQADLTYLNKYLRVREGSGRQFDSDAFGVLTYLLASTYTESPEELDDSRKILKELGYAIDLPELQIIDGRNMQKYSVGHGLGLYSN